MINAGERRHYMTVEVPKKTPDGHGGFTNTWTPKYRVWAKLTPISAREKIAADKPEMNVSHAVTIPHLDRFKPEWRLTKRSRVFEIVSVINPGECNDDLQLLCKERLS